MIKSFRHKGLKRFFEQGRADGVSPKHTARLSQILALLNTADSVEDMNLPGLKLHELKGKRKGTWSITVSGNWRITFTITEHDVLDVNYEDYH